MDRIVGILVRNGEDWMETEGGDLVIPVKTPSAATVLSSLATGEEGASPAAGSLFERFKRVNDALTEAIKSGPEGAAAVMATIRLSAIRQLPWYAAGRCKVRTHQRASFNPRRAGLSSRVSSLGFCVDSTTPASKKMNKITH